MPTWIFWTALLLGVMAAVPYALAARRSRHPRRLLGAGLAVAAAIYIGFAVVSGDAKAVLVEVGGTLLFGAIVFFGLRLGIGLLAVGWALHVVWDVALHPMDGSGYAPAWYPVACIGFDLLVAALAWSIRRSEL